MGYNTIDRVDLRTTLDDVNDAITTYPKCSYTNITASTLIKTGSGQIYGILVNSHLTGIIKVWDNTTNSTTAVGGQIALPTAGTTIDYKGATTGTGIYVELISGTADLTVLWR
jgi:hypothetical protein